MSTDREVAGTRPEAAAHHGAMRNVDVPTVRRLLLTRDDLIGDGWSRRHIDRAVASGELHRLRPGRYMLREQWEQLWPQSRHLAHVAAVHDDALQPPVFAFVSAAAVHGLPLFRVAVERVHTVHPDAARRTVPNVVRHQAQVADGDVVEVAGIRCTSPERTVYDLARLASAEVAAVCTDAVLGRIGGDPRRYREADAAEWLERMRDRTAVAGARGIRQARMILDLADGRSQLPLEVVTKVQLRRLGFRQPRLQVPVPARGGGTFWMDIELDEADAFWECDGEGKYTDEAMRSGRTVEQVLLEEKAREDWVRGVTNRRVLRGGSADAATPAALAARLRSFGVALPDRRHRLLLPRRPLLHGQ